MMIQILFVLVFLVFFFIGAGISIKIIADAKRFNIHFEKCRMEKRKQKEKGYRNKRGSIHNRFTRREPYTDFICMTEGKNSEAHVKHARETEASAYHYPKKDDSNRTGPALSGPVLYLILRTIFNTIYIGIERRNWYAKH